MREYSVLDKCCMGVDGFLKTVMGHPKRSRRPYPAQGALATTLALNASQCHYSAALMRINHAGEIAAQALYHGQSIASRDEAVRLKMQLAAVEEGDHLAWCRQRVLELGSHVSYLVPFWYVGSFMIGLTAGAMGDRWSLGFLAETERQVVQHLENHLQVIAQYDPISHAIIKQMQEDEENHRETALAAGAIELPDKIKFLMRMCSKAMVKIAYWI